MTSSSKKQVSSWLPDQKHGIFTYYFLQSIQNQKETDENNDGIISYQESFNYVKNRVYKEAIKHNREQNAFITGDKERILFEK